MQRSKPFSVSLKRSYVPYIKEGIVGDFDFGLWQSHKVRRAGPLSAYPLRSLSVFAFLSLLSCFALELRSLSVQS
jgi:hypothetical protein